MARHVDPDPQQAVLNRLSDRHDHFVSTERKAHKQGRTAEAEGAHRVALWILRAYAAERDNPTPKGDTLTWKS